MCVRCDRRKLPWDLVRQRYELTLKERKHLGVKDV